MEVVRVVVRVAAVRVVAVLAAVTESPMVAVARLVRPRAQMGAQMGAGEIVAVRSAVVPEVAEETVAAAPEAEESAPGSTVEAAEGVASV